MRSSYLERTRVMEMGLQSEKASGDMEIGIIGAAFHCLGTVVDDNDRFIMSAILGQKRTVNQSAETKQGCCPTP